jgi:hypothetical protein
MQTMIITLLLLAILIPFGAIALLFRVTSVNKPKHGATKTTVVENENLYKELF